MTPYTKLRREALDLAKQYEKTVCDQVKLADKICSIAKEYLNAIELQTL